MGIAAGIGAIATSLGASAGAAAFIGAAGQFLITTAATSFLARRNLPGEPGVRARTLTSRGTVDAEAIIYGRAVVAGTLAYRAALGQKNRDLWAVHCLAGHEVEGIRDVWLDDKRITNLEINNGDPAGGQVISGDFGPVRNQAVVQVYKQLGTDTQAALQELVDASGDWTTAHQLRGIAYGATVFSLWDKTEKLWEAGDPGNVKFEVLGKRVYDPRLDDLNGGSGPQRVDDPTTWAWSENPALCTADLLRDAKFSPLMGGVPSSRISWTAVIAAADACDVLVDVPGGQEKRFTCNGALYGTAAPEDNITAVMASMNGTLVFTGGMYVIHAGVYAAPTDQLDEKDIIGPVQYSSALSSTERINTIKATYIDREKENEPTETAPIFIQSLLDRDNGNELIDTIELPMTDKWFETQRICIKRLAEANQELTIQVPCNLRAARLVPGERVAVTIQERGWVDKTFKVLKWEIFDRGGDQVGVNVSLREDDSAAYADPADTDYNTLAPGGDLVLADPELVPSVDTIPRGINYGVGSWSMRLRPNENGNGDPNPGEIGVDVGRFLLPDFSIRTISEVMTIATPWEGAATVVPPDGVFYVVWGEEDCFTRFPGGDWSTQSGRAGFFSAIYDRFNDEWFATDNINTEFPFTPLGTDYVIARGTRIGSDPGISSFTTVVPYVTDSVLVGVTPGLVELTPRADRTYEAIDTDPGDAQVIMRSRTDRVLAGLVEGGTVGQDTYQTVGNPSLVEVRATLISGPGPAGSPLGTWLPADVEQEWRINRTIVGSITTELDIEYREAGDPGNTTIARYTCIATVNASAPTLGTISNDTFATTVTDPFNATTELEVRTNGNLVEVNNGADGTSQQWLSAGAANLCEVRCEVLNGSLSGGDATDTWLPMTTLRQWQRNRTTVGTNAATVRITIREIANTSNLITAEYVLGATVQAGGPGPEGYPQFPDGVDGWGELIA